MRNSVASDKLRTTPTTLPTTLRAQRHTMHFQGTFYSRLFQLLLLLLLSCGFAAAFNMQRSPHQDDRKTAFSNVYLPLIFDGCPTPTPTPQPTPSLQPRVDEVITVLNPSLVTGSPGDTLKIRGSLTNTTSAPFAMIGYGLVTDFPICSGGGNAPTCPILEFPSFYSGNPLPPQSSTGEIDIIGVRLNPAYAGPLPTVIKFTFYTTRQGAFTGFADVWVRIQPRTDPARPPLLFTDPCTQQAVVLDSVNLTGGPFALENALNLSSDHRTRLMVFAWNMNLQPGEGAGDVSVEAIDTQQTIHSLPVESVSDVVGEGGLTQIIVKLPDSLAEGGELSLRIRIHEFTTNEAPITIKRS